MSIKYKVMVDIYPEDNMAVDYTGVLYDTFEDAQEEYKQALSDQEQFGLINYAYITEVHINEDKKTHKE